MHVKDIISPHLHVDDDAHECRSEREITDHEGQAGAGRERSEGINNKK